MEYIFLALFCVSLFVCVLLDVSVIYALLAGLVIFSVYALIKGYSVKNVIDFSVTGVKTVKNILITFILIGMLTALWRDSGTIPVIVCYASRLITPPVFLLMTFLLNCLISVLTGTAFGTAATMGVICSTMGGALGIAPFFTGGAVLSGAFFGDRCSPVSTSALLTATLTKTDIFDNIKKMLKTAAIPFLLTSVIYTLTGIKLKTQGEIADLNAVFGAEFSLSLLCIIPAVILLILAICRVNVKITMAVSIVSSVPISIFVQHTPLKLIPKLLLTGFTAENGEVAAMLNGGGIKSMLRVSAIVLIASAFSGIFQKTGMLDSIKANIKKLSSATTPFAAILVTSVLTGLIACNQSLTIMLTNQLTEDCETDKSRLAIALEDTAVVIAPLVPWSIAGAVPLNSVSAPLSAIAFACFLYILPMCGLIKSVYKKIKRC